jgi:deoxyribonuclease IV
MLTIRKIKGNQEDRHENIGHWYIGLQALNYIVHHPQLTKLPNFWKPHP